MKCVALAAASFGISVTLQACGSSDSPSPSPSPSPPAPAAWTSQFDKPDPSRFTHMKGVRHCDDVCFEADDTMLEYNAELSGGKQGLRVTTSSDVCKGCAKAGDTCFDVDRGNCTTFSSQYLMSADPISGKGNYYHYGDYEVSMRTGYRADGSSPAGTFSCFTPGTTPAHGDDDPLHNEIALCFDGANATRAKFLYWYNQKIQKNFYDLGFDSSKELHTYGISWRPDSITWSVDGKQVHVDKGIAGKTIPWEKTVMVAGLLKPHGEAAVGTYHLEVEHVSYTPCADCDGIMV